ADWTPKGVSLSPASRLLILLEGGRWNVLLMEEVCYGNALAGFASLKVITRRGRRRRQGLEFLPLDNEADQLRHRAKPFSLIIHSCGGKAFMQCVFSRLVAVHRGENG